MFEDGYHRHWKGPFPFTEDSVREEAPAVFGVYQVLYMKDAPTTAYVGVATGDTIRGRLLKHVRAKGNWALGRLEDRDAFRFAYFPCVPEDARQIESHIILREQPPFNVKPEYKHYIPSISLH